MFQKHFFGSFYGSLELTYCVCLRPGLYKPKRSVWSKKALLVLLTLHNECSFCQTSDREKSYFSITLFCRRLMPPSTGTKNEIHRPCMWVGMQTIYLLPFGFFPFPSSHMHVFLIVAYLLILISLIQLGWGCLAEVQVGMYFPFFWQTKVTQLSFIWDVSVHKTVYFQIFAKKSLQLITTKCSLCNY